MHIGGSRGIRRGWRGSREKSQRDSRAHKTRVFAPSRDCRPWHGNPCCPKGGRFEDNNECEAPVTIRHFIVDGKAAFPKRTGRSVMRLYFCAFSSHANPGSPFLKTRSTTLE